MMSDFMMPRFVDFITALAFLVYHLGAALGWIWLFLGLLGMWRERRKQKQRMERADAFVRAFNAEQVANLYAAHTAATRKRDLRKVVRMVPRGGPDGPRAA